MSIGNVVEQLELNHVGMGIRKVAQIVNFGDFTDGGGTTGTLILTKQIPAGSLVMCSKVTVKTGFAGDTTAVMDIGDGSDADIFSQTTHNIFAAARNLMETCDIASSGAGRGTVAISSDTSITLTVTAGSDFGAITAGKMLVEVFYLSTNVELTDDQPTEIRLNN